MYRVWLNEDLICETDWPPMAQTAWIRASSNRNSAQHGGVAIIEKNGRVIARVKPKTPGGHEWPDEDVPVVTMHDVVKQVVLLLREDGYEAKDIANMMTDLGLPTTRSRIDSLRGGSGSSAAAYPAEIVVMIQSVINDYHKTG